MKVEKLKHKKQDKSIRLLENGSHTAQLQTNGQFSKNNSITKMYIKSNWKKEETNFTSVSAH